MGKRSLTKKLGADCVERITKAIHAAEQTTSAEIAVYVREWTFLSSLFGASPTTDAVRKKAEALFVAKHLDATTDRNAVMLYVSLREKIAVVLGDKAIHERVKDEDWKAITGELKAANTVAGIEAAVARAGRLLSAHFPTKAAHHNQIPDAPNLG